MARFLRTDLGHAHSRLGPPLVVGAGIAFGGPGTRLADPANVRDVRRAAHSALRPPTVLLVPASEEQRRLRLHLAPSTDVPLRRRAFSKLRGPVVVFAVPLAQPIKTTTAARSAPRDQRRSFALTSKIPAATVGGGLIDDFNRGSLGANWSTIPAYGAVGGIFIVSGNQAAASPVAESVGYWNQAIYPADVGVGATIATVGSGLYLFLRVQWPNGRATAPTDFRAYRLKASGSGWRIDALHNQQTTIVASGADVFSAGDVVRFEASGSTFTVYQNGVVITTATDASAFVQGSGYVGLGFVINSGAAEDFTVAAPTVAGWNTYLGPRRPAVVNPAAAPSQQQQTIVARLAPSTNRPRAPHSHLAPPVVVTPAVTPFVAPPLAVRLAVQATLATLPARKAHPRLAPPAVVGDGVVFAPILVSLAAQRQQNRVYPERAVHSRLFPPTVVLSSGVFAGPLVRLARATRPGVKSLLRSPVIPPLAAPVTVRLAPRPQLGQRAPHSRLIAPAVVGAGVYFRPIEVKLAPSTRGKPRSHLAPPAVVGDGIFFAPVAITLAPSTRGKPSSRLSAPTVVGGGIYFYPVRVTLAPSRRGKPSSRLFAPVIPPVARPVETEIAVQLVRASLAERQPRSRLVPPAVVGAGIYFYPLFVTLAPSKRGVPKSRLAPPAAVGAGLYFYPVRVVLAPSKRGQPRSILRAPILPPLAPPIEEKLSVQLARFEQPGERTHSRLSPPTVVFVATELTTAVTLSRLDLRRRQSHPKLGPPAVVGDGIVFRSLAVRLAPSTDVPLRRRAEFRLEPPAVVQAATVVFSGPVVHLAPSKRGIPKSRLQPPAVVGAGRVFRALDVTLAPSRRGKPSSRLSPPSVVGTPPFRPVAVTLAPSRRPLAKSALRPPIIPPLARAVEVRLASLRRQPPRTAARLAPPTVVGAQVTYPLRVVLARIRPVRVSYHLAPPAVVLGAVLYPIATRLAPSARPRPSSVLRPPAVVATLATRPLAVALTRIRPVRVASILRAPAVVAPYLPPVVTTLGVHLAVLARNASQPARRAHWHLSGPSAIIVTTPGFTSGYNVPRGGAESRDVPDAGGSAESHPSDKSEGRSVAGGGSTIRDVPDSRGASRDKRRPLT